MAYIENSKANSLVDGTNENDTIKKLGERRNARRLGGQRFN